MSVAFHDQHVVASGDNLTKIAAAAGFKNPGPLAAYPENARHFRSRSPDVIQPGERLFIPYHPDKLNRIINGSRQIIQMLQVDAQALIDEQYRDKQELERFLGRIDAINFISNLGIGSAFNIAKAASGGMTSSSAMSYLSGHLTTIGSNVATMAVRTPEAPRRNLGFWVRHTLGPWNPSFWTSVAIAIQERDLDIYLYGSDAIAHKTSLKIKKQADADVNRLRVKIREMQTQLAMPFYRVRI